MSTDVYNSIPEQYRAILDEEINATCLAYNATVDGNEEAALKTFRDYGTTIIELSDEERQAFAGRLQGYVHQYPELFSRHLQYNPLDYRGGLTEIGVCGPAGGIQCRRQAAAFRRNPCGNTGKAQL